jgi:hypothetical protein
LGNTRSVGAGQVRDFHNTSHRTARELFFNRKERKERKETDEVVNFFSAIFAISAVKRT